MSDSASAMSSVTGPGSHAPSASRGRGSGDGGARIFVVDVTVLAATTPLKPQMPISIQSNLPHIPIKFGNNLNEPNCPTIRCAVDTSETAPCPLQPCYFDKWDIFADTWDCQYALGLPVCIFNNLLLIFPISCHLLMSE